MKENEKVLLKELCKYKSDSFDASLLSFASPSVLGHLFFNRMQGIACDTLRRHGLLSEVNREFRNSLQGAYEQNVEKNRSYFRCVTLISRLLSKCDCNAAMLKGAFLCAHYPQGYRTSNDIDLLVLPEDVSKIGRILERAGFKQGNVRNGQFVPATRKEIITSKMTRGETVPYIKEVALPGMKFLEVDINFSLDYKSGETDVLAAVLDKVDIVKENGLSLPILAKADFFIHLCAHLYKEATTLPWIEMHRDMTLYKYCDIYMLLTEMTEADVDALFARAVQLGMEKICAYAIWETAGLFDLAEGAAACRARAVLADNPAFLLTVVSPREKKLYMYQTADVNERFFMEDRVSNLREVLSYAIVADA